MATPSTPDVSELQEWLEHVRTKESAQWLMIAIAVKQGVDPGDLAGWYDVELRDIEGWIDRLDTERPSIPIAEREGIDFSELANRYGMAEPTVRDWFIQLLPDDPEAAAALIARYSGQRAPPAFRQDRARVDYLDFETLDEHGWSLTDPDLFQKASDAGLDSDDYGRIVVEPGETILEAAENRGMEWPFACRSGACANCAVIVLEGDIAMPGNNILTDDQINTANARLTCLGIPVTDSVKLVKNAQKLDQFDDLLLPSPID